MVELRPRKRRDGRGAAISKNEEERRNGTQIQVASPSTPGRRRRRRRMSRVGLHDAEQQASSRYAWQYERMQHPSHAPDQLHVGPKYGTSPEAANGRPTKDPSRSARLAEKSPSTMSYACLRHPKT